MKDVKDVQKNIVIYWALFFFSLALLFPIDYISSNNYPEYLIWDKNGEYHINNNLADVIVNGPIGILLCIMLPVLFLPTFLILQYNSNALFINVLIQLYLMNKYRYMQIAWHYLLVGFLSLIELVIFYYVHSNMTPNFFLDGLEVIGPKGLGYYSWLFSYIFLFCGMLVEYWRNSRNKYNMANFKK